MKKKLLALSAALALGLPIFSAFYMCVKLDTNDISKFDVEDIEEVSYDKSDATPSKKNMYIVNKACDTTIYNVNKVVEVFYEKIADTTAAEISESPLSFRTLTDSTAEVSGYSKKYFTDEDGIIEEKEMIIPSNVKIKDVVYSVTGIGKDAFSACAGLIGITLPTSIVSIEDKAFNNCKGLKAINIPSNVASIGEESFQNCTGLTSITLPSSVKNVGDWAFYGCTYLDVVIDNAKENIEIGAAAFDGCKSVSFTIESPVVEDPIKSKYRILPDATAEMLGGCLETVVIPERVTIDGRQYLVSSIAANAFVGCDSLKNIEIPENITVIGQSAFFNCINLDIVINNSSDNLIVGDNAFSGCKSVKYLKDPVIPEDTTTVDSATSPLIRYKVLNDSTVEVTHNQMYAALDTIIIPDTVRIAGTLYNVVGIGDSVFAGCKNIKVVELPSSLIRIGIMAFSGCDSMVAINIPESVAIIDEEAFDGCERLTDIMIPNGMVKINFASFANCKGLRNIEIPESVTIIDRYAFANCDSLNITINNSEDDVEIGENAFDKCKSVKFTKESTIPNATDLAISLKVTSDSTVEVSKSNTSKVYGTIVIPEKVRIDHKVYTVTNIGTSAFESCNNLTSVTIPSTVTAIGDNAFSLCKTLIKVNIPESVTSIGNSSFADCYNLRDIEIPASVETIAELAFAYSKNLEIEIKNSEENVEVGKNAFYGVKSVTWKE